MIDHDRDYIVPDLEPLPRQPAVENPKELQGRKKIEHHHTPRLPALYQAAVHELGARKYGSFKLAVPVDQVH